MSSIRIVAVALGLIGGLAACFSDPDPVDITETGAIANGDDVHPADGSLYDEYTFKAKAGWNIHITMSSTEVDSFIQVRRPDVSDDTFLQEADDIAPTDRNADLQFSAPATGNYTVWANTAGAADRGAYTLTIKAEPPK